MKNVLLAIISLTGGIVSGIVGGFDTLFVILCLLMLIDYITGIMKGIYNKNLDSRVGLFGILKKLVIVLIVVVAVCIDKLFILKGVEYEFIRDIVIMFYIINEIISIIENVGVFVPVPKKIKNILEQLKNISDDIE